MKLHPSTPSGAYMRISEPENNTSLLSIGPARLNLGEIWARIHLNSYIFSIKLNEPDNYLCKMTDNLTIWLPSCAKHNICTIGICHSDFSDNTISLINQQQMLPIILTAEWFWPQFHLCWPPPKKILIDQIINDDRAFHPLHVIFVPAGCQAVTLNYDDWLSIKHRGKHLCQIVRYTILRYVIFLYVWFVACSFH